MIQELEQRINRLEEWIKYSADYIKKEIKGDKEVIARSGVQSLLVPHLFSALCVNTIDPMASGQVQYYTPFTTAPGTTVDACPWAYPISPFGGFDDSGVTWVPPAGSKLALLFENGNVNQAYYFGTFWPGSRGISPTSSSDLPSEDDNRLDVWGIDIPEYSQVWEGNRGGYNLGSNAGDQVKMPWNTDNYQTQDWDTQTDFNANPNANNYVTYPHIHGFKTPGKHYWKGQDGDHKCNEKWSRTEWASGRTNIIMLKDDHLHPAAQWAFNNGINDDSICHSPIGDSYANATIANENANCQAADIKANTNSGVNTDEFANPYYKRKEEMRFYQAPPALAMYANPKCELPQSGVQIQSLSGMQFVLDDSVDQPQGKPDWQLDFDWGCNDIFKGKMFMRSATGHYIGMDDAEDDTLIRSANNGIRIQMLIIM